jgi:biopolymer transport protein ExbD|tara:strand:- start:325 stop:627 length:303 start_codon:yes stop_codon:yes gene_type:complete
MIYVILILIIIILCLVNYKKKNFKLKFPKNNLKCKCDVSENFANISIKNSAEKKFLKKNKYPIKPLKKKSKIDGYNSIKYENLDEKKNISNDKLIFLNFI